MSTMRARRSDEERCNADIVNIVVLQAESHQFGLVVGEINDTQEIVVKPLGQHLKGVVAYAGSTIMGDGTVSLILDVLGLAQKSHVVSEHAGRQLIKSQESELEQSSIHNSYLIVVTILVPRFACRKWLAWKKFRRLTSN